MKTRMHTPWISHELEYAISEPPRVDEDVDSDIIAAQVVHAEDDIGHFRSLSWSESVFSHCLAIKFAHKSSERSTLAFRSNPWVCLFLLRYFGDLSSRSEMPMDAKTAKSLPTDLEVKKRPLNHLILGRRKVC